MISLEKVTINIGVGAAGEKLEKAKNLLKKLTGQQPVETTTKKRIPTWELRKGLAIGTKVTLRGQKAEDFLKKCLEAKDKTLEERNFEEKGNVSFGIKEYIDLPGVKYDPSIGVFGFDVCVTLKKWGYGITKRKIKQSKMPKRHIIKKQEGIEYVKQKFGVEVSK